MAIKTSHELNEDTWFITFTCYNWIPLFEITQSYDIFYDWLQLVKNKHQIETLAFVIMPNHVHVLFHLNDLTINLNTVISNGKRFMAYEIISRLHRGEKHELLNQLSGACSNKEIAKGQKHKVFKTSFDAKPIFTEKFLQQKIDYIHHNPVNGKWNLAHEYTDYLHSSAAFYIDEKVHLHFTVSNYKDYW